MVFVLFAVGGVGAYEVLEVACDLIVTCGSWKSFNSIVKINLINLL